MIAPKNTARLNRQFERISRRFPLTARFISWVRKPSSRILRIPLGIVLVLGGIFSFLPVLGIWMLPLGLLMLAIDQHRHGAGRRQVRPGPAPEVPQQLRP
ncbi:MAG: hypothetical protein ACO1OK_06270, partial [Devosia sp.]